MIHTKDIFKDCTVHLPRYSRFSSSNQIDHLKNYVLDSRKAERRMTSLSPIQDRVLGKQPWRGAAPTVTAHC